MHARLGLINPRKTRYTGQAQLDLSKLHDDPLADATVISYNMGTRISEKADGQRSRSAT
jgi:hypothetical protein